MTRLYPRACTRLAIGALFGCLGTTLAQASTPAATAPATEPGRTRETFPNLLQSYGAKFALYFTIERDEVDLRATVKDAAGNPKRSALDSHGVWLSPTAGRDASSFQQALQKALPEADVFVDEKLPNVVHIREKSLAARKNYALEEKTDFLFSGTTGELMREVKWHADWPLEEDYAYFVNEPHYDFRVLTQVYQKDATFRTILSAGALQWGGRVLWASRAVEKDGSLVVLVKLHVGTPAADAATDPATLPAAQQTELDDVMQRRKAAELAAAVLLGRPDVPVITETDALRIALTEKVITVRTPLRNIPAKLLLQDLGPLLHPDAKSGTLESPNSVVLSDQSARVNTYLQIIERLEKAAGARRATAVAKGADHHGLEWVKSLPAPAIRPLIAPVEAPKIVPDRYVAPVYFNGDPSQILLSDKIVTQVIPLTSASAPALYESIKSLIDSNAVVVASSTANCLVINDVSARVQRLAQIIQRLDQPPRPAATAPR
jgi:hypothetical protein